VLVEYVTLFINPKAKQKFLKMLVEYYVPLAKKFYEHNARNESNP